jgi:DNA modification methylase
MKRHRLKENVGQIESQIHLGDCLKVMQDFDDRSIDAVITDLPYG